MMAVLTPIISPTPLTNGPPLFPGLTATSLCIKSLYRGEAFGLPPRAKGLRIGSS